MAFPKLWLLDNSANPPTLCLIYKIIIITQLPKIYLFDNIICVYTNKNITFRRYGENLISVSQGKETFPNI